MLHDSTAMAESCSSSSSSTRPYVSVTAIDGEDTIMIAFYMMGKDRKMLRPQNEPLEKTLKRIALSAVNRKDKKGRRGRRDGSPVSSPVVRLIKGKEDVLGTMPTVQAWKEGDQLVVGEERYTVLLNCPMVKSFSQPVCYMAGGYPIVPEVELQFSDPAHCSWTWKRLPIDSSSNLTNVSSSMVYWTSDNDLGHQLEIECIPQDHNGRSGEPFSVTTAPVLPSPSLSAITLRHQHTQQCLSSQDELRVVSYNILAEYYSSTDYAKQVLYPYCQPNALLISYRQCLLARELIGYHADILCLQEVGKKCFEQFLLPVMRDSGYDGCFAQKTGQVLEGEAIFYRCSKFKVVNTSSVALTQFLIEDESCSELYSALQKAPTVMSDLQKMRTILQTSVLQSIDCPSCYICVANTHLYFHPAADHIRLIQSVVSAKALYKTKKEFTQSTVGISEVAVIFCGDFNSCPCIGAYEFLTKGFLGHDHQDWTKYKLGLIPKCGCAAVPDNESMYIPSLHMRQLIQDEVEQPVSMSVDDRPAPHLCAEITDGFAGLDVNHSLSLQDAYCTHLIIPYTNFTLGFKCVLDYIFIDSNHLLVTRAIPLPSHDKLTEHVALPSVSFPSDHLALVADLKWKAVSV